MNRSRRKAGSIRAVADALRRVRELPPGQQDGAESLVALSNAVRAAALPAHDLAVLVVDRAVLAKLPEDERLRSVGMLLAGLQGHLFPEFEFAARRRPSAPAEVQ